MRMIDLTHVISETMPVYPGTKPPTLTTGSRYEIDGFRETILTLYSHTGTHMDAPNHLYQDRTMLDVFPVSQFIGSAVVVDCTNKKAGEAITMDDLGSVRECIDSADFLLFHTGWSCHWGTREYFGEYPCLDNDVLDYVSQTKKKGVGLDVIGLDPVSDSSLSRHRRLFSKSEAVVIENLTNLDQLGTGLFTFIALPIKFEHADGAPVRAVACLDGL